MAHDDARSPRTMPLAMGPAPSRPAPLKLSPTIAASIDSRRSITGDANLETDMALEQACVQVMPKPWGSTDLLPWSEVDHGGTAIGELWFQRHDLHATEPALLLKLLFTQEALSIQVHPDDAFAQAMGLARGKTEAWYILSASPDATIGVGLKSALTQIELRAAITDGSIAHLLQWRKARKGDVIFVPAGTIHAIGPGLVLAEIQQRSDTTFRLFDHGRRRELHIEEGVAAALAGPAAAQEPARRLSEARTLLVASPYFVLERLELPSGSVWDLHANHETWLIVIAGEVRLGSLQARVGEGCFIEADSMRIEAGRDGLTCLVAYDAAGPCPDLLHAVPDIHASAPADAASAPPLPLPALAGSSNLFTEARP
ncbi:class I mannose-6-phosphate isomerase [Bosea sp. BIWAKO-01]|uniref:class I mannose-6-phosphate isomerase n=1 Tax=Bosea sp. BIWAKO-01 TaxID=506668 RepID=UPI000868C3A2|nr:class I mannose-6-phosphate isomerase [Bosea sp. BIWAKO-01]GAU85439.1 mannose-6-phosphate isomerase [Bosea sp. BIWAKO-01]